MYDRPIPFLDLREQYRRLKPEIDDAVLRVLASCAYAGGPEVAAFEESYASWCGARHAVGVSSGTDALRFALAAAGIGPGDEVLTVTNTFIATTEAISQVGAKMVLVDVDPRTCLMDTARLEAALTPRTRAVVPVHLYGQPVAMDPLLELADRKGLQVIEDACQAHGALYRTARPVSPDAPAATIPGADAEWRPAGTLGRAGCFSFYPGKNLGAAGEAGLIVTDDDELAATARCLRDHGQYRKYHHDREGYNGRMDGIQGAVLAVKLRHLDAWNARRRAIAERYDDHFRGTSVMPIEQRDDARGVYHLYVVRVRNRRAVQDALDAAQVAWGLHYPVPLHQQEAYRHLGIRTGTFPVSEAQANASLSLPIYPEMEDAAVDRVAQVVLEAVGAAALQGESR